MKNVYKISTNLTKKQNIEFTNNLSTDELEFLNTINIDQMIDVVENDFIVSYVICTELNLEKFKTIFYSYNILFEIKNITKKFLKGHEKINDIIFLEYLENNLTIEDVLDKISELGIEALTDFDKTVLNS